MIRRLFVPLLFVLIIISLGVVYLRFNPPLHISSLGTYEYADKRGITVNISNQGFASLQIDRVYVNERENPEISQLGISRSFALVQMLTSKENEEQGISFYSLSDYKVQPELSDEQKQKIPKDDRNIIKDYAINIQNHNKPIQRVIIQYTYFDMPFTLEKNLQ